MLKLLNDKIPEFWAVSGKVVKTRSVLNDIEFFSLLKDKIQEDVIRIFTNNNVENKAKSLADVYIDLEPLKDKLENKLSLIFDDYIEERSKKTGKFKNRLVLESTKVLSLEDKKKFVTEFGKNNSYPEMILKSDKNNKPYKVLGRGQKAWESALGWADLTPPNNENFDDLFMAVNAKMSNNASG